MVSQHNNIKVLYAGTPEPGRLLSLPLAKRVQDAPSFRSAVCSDFLLSNKLSQYEQLQMTK